MKATISVYEGIDKEIYSDTLPYLSISSSSPNNKNMFLSNIGTPYPEAFYSESVMIEYTKYPLVCEAYRGEKSQGNWSIGFQFLGKGRDFIDSDQRDPKLNTYIKEITLDIFGH
jgi:hypothetical protein